MYVAMYFLYIVHPIRSGLFKLDAAASLEMASYIEIAPLGDAKTNGFVAGIPAPARTTGSAKYCIIALTVSGMMIGIPLAPYKRKQSQQCHDLFIFTTIFTSD